MGDVLEFLHMGGYATYVWSSYAFTGIVLGGVVWWSGWQGRRIQRDVWRRASARTRPGSPA